tara:strand:+ start:3272 stop:3787 length:516 start_codon:yes stop_codon:yes gene_type:complete
MVGLSLENNMALQTQGYDLDLIGFEESQIPLYLHKEKLSDKKRGDVFMQFHVNSPANLTAGEADYLIRKAQTMGLFPWPPGEDCLRRDFTPQWHEAVAGGGSRLVKGETQSGCGYCLRSSREDSVNSGHSADEAEPDTVIKAEPAFVTGSSSEVSPPNAAPRRRRKRRVKL